MLPEGILTAGDGLMDGPSPQLQIARTSSNPLNEPFFWRFRRSVLSNAVA